MIGGPIPVHPEARIECEKLFLLGIEEEANDMYWLRLVFQEVNNRGTVRPNTLDLQRRSTAHNVAVLSRSKSRRPTMVKR
jgi:hypothetical protein